MNIVFKSDATIIRNSKYWFVFSYFKEIIKRYFTNSQKKEHYYEFFYWWFTKDNCNDFKYYYISESKTQFMGVYVEFFALVEKIAKLSFLEYDSTDPSLIRKIEETTNDEELRKDIIESYYNIKKEIQHYSKGSSCYVIYNLLQILWDIQFGGYTLLAKSEADFRELQEKKIKHYIKSFDNYKNETYQDSMTDWVDFFNGNLTLDTEYCNEFNHSMSKQLLDTVNNRL